MSSDPELEDSPAEALDGALQIQPNTLYRFVQGLDESPARMTEAELAELRDPFGQLLRSGQDFPLSLRAALSAVDSLSGDAALPRQLVFLAADGGHIPWSPETAALQRAFRLAVARGAGAFTLLISATTVADSTLDRHFLQVLGWDAVAEVFHFYERREGTFFWAGNGSFALSSPTRGRGPFDSHVNGSLVMKELRQPWVHWHAPAAGITDASLAPDDPFRNDPLFQNLATADLLELQVVRPGISRWNRARVQRAVSTEGTWLDAPQFLRQVVATTTVNVVTTDEVASLIQSDTSLQLPPSFFVNVEGLLDAVELEVDLPPIVISGRHYLESLRRYDTHRTDGTLRIEGDSHFAFLVPEPAHEDMDLLGALIRAGLISRRLAACLLMVDFSNPVFSPRREALLAGVPATVAGGNAQERAERLEAGILEWAQQTANSDNPAAEFLSLWDLGPASWEDAFNSRLTDFFQALLRAAGTDEGVDGWFRLAESRRRAFRRRPLHEFRLTTPRTNIPEETLPLRLRPDGLVEPML